MYEIQISIMHKNSGSSAWKLRIIGMFVLYFYRCWVTIWGQRLLRMTTDGEVSWLDHGPVLEKKFGRHGGRNGQTAQGSRKSTELWVSSPGCNTYPVTLASNLFLDLVICHFLKMWFGRSVQATQIYDSAWEEGRKEGWCELWRSVGALMQERKQEIAGMNGKCPSLFLHLRQFIEGPRGEVMATALSFAQWVLSLSGILQRLQAKTLERRKGCCIIQWDFKFWKSITKEPPFPLLKPPSSSVDSQFLHPSTLAYKQ